MKVIRLSSSFRADIELIFSSTLCLLLFKVTNIFHVQKQRIVKGMITNVTTATEVYDIGP